MGCGASTQTLKLHTSKGPAEKAIPYILSPRVVEASCDEDVVSMTEPSISREPDVAPEPEQRPFPPPLLRPEHRAFVIDTICWQRYYLTDDTRQRPYAAGDTTGESGVLHFCLMEPWRHGFTLHARDSTPVLEVELVATNSTVVPSKRSVVFQWLAGIAGLEHKASSIEDQLYLQLWTHGLPLTFGGVPLDLEATCGERSLAYLYQLASKFDADTVDTWTRLADFSKAEAEIFEKELLRLRGKIDAADAAKMQVVQPVEIKKDATKKLQRRRPEMKRLGEDPEVRRRAAQKIQAAERGRWARREAEERRRERSRKSRKKTVAEKMRDEQLRHEELIRQHEAASKIQAAQRGKQGRRRAQTRKTSKGRLRVCDADERQSDQHRNSRKQNQDCSMTHKTKRQQRKQHSNCSRLEGKEERVAATKIQAAHRGKRSRQLHHRKTSLRRREQQKPPKPRLESSRATTGTDVAAFKAALAHYDRVYEPQARLRESQRREEEKARAVEEEQKRARAAEEAAARQERSRRLHMAGRRAKMLARLHNPTPLNVSALEVRRLRYTEALEAALVDITSSEMPLDKSIAELSMTMATKTVTEKEDDQLRQQDQVNSTATHNPNFQEHSAIPDCIDGMIRIIELYEQKMKHEQGSAVAIDEIVETVSREQRAQET